MKYQKDDPVSLDDDFINSRDGYSPEPPVVAAAYQTIAMYQELCALRAENCQLRQNIESHRAWLRQMNKASEQDWVALLKIVLERKWPDQDQ